MGGGGGEGMIFMNSGFDGQYDYGLIVPLRYSSD